MKHQNFDAARFEAALNEPLKGEMSEDDRLAAERQILEYAAAAKSSGVIFAGDSNSGEICRIDEKTGALLVYNTQPASEEAA